VEDDRGRFGEEDRRLFEPNGSMVSVPSGEEIDDIRPQLRTPRYAPGTRTDFLLAPEAIAVVIKQYRPGLRESQLLDQVREDAEHYRRERTCRNLVVFVYDPEGLLPELPPLTDEASPGEGELDVRCVVAVLR